MYCKNCGQVIPDGYTYCPYCNTATDNEPNTNSTAPNGNGTYFTPNTNDGSYQQGTYRQDSYQQNNGYNQNTQDNFFNQGNNSQYGFNQQAQYYTEASKNLDDAKTLGILAIVLGILFSPVVGIICGIIGLAKVNSVPDMPETFEKKAQAKKLNNLGIAIPIALWCVAIIIMIFVFAGIAGFAGASYY